ncbi:MAG TPA: EthD family reductase, partial [Candidatus Binataceae bacterium]|nr:EthD family reductase [Candidatus Binataceae bacterium]
IAKRLPGLRMYMTSKLMEMRGEKPAHLRAALLWFDDEESRTKAFEGEAAVELFADSQAHLKDITRLQFEAEPMVALKLHEPGRKYFAFAAEFDLDAPNGYDAAERRYLNDHTALAKRLPDLRGYYIGKLTDSGRPRIAILFFDSIDAFRASYASQIGQELVADEKATIRNARVVRLDTQVVV